MFYDYIEEFAGLPVTEFPSTAPSREAATRLRDDWESTDSWEVLFESFVDSPGAKDVSALLLGTWATDDPLDDASAVLDRLVEAAPKLPSLRALFFGDITTEESEVSWIHAGDLAMVARAFPQLEQLWIRYGEDLTLDGLRHDRLHTLVIQTGGMAANVTRQVLAAELPALTHLELYLGTPYYGGDTTIAELEPLLSGRVHRGVRHLGIRNATIADAVAAALSRSPVLDRIEVLDLSLGTLGDEGMIALSQASPTPNLQRLDLHHHYAGPGAVDAVTAEMTRRGVAVDTSDPRDGEDEDRWVAISE